MNGTSSDAKVTKVATASISGSEKSHFKAIKKRNNDYKIASELKATWEFQAVLTLAKARRWPKWSRLLVYVLRVNETEMKPSTRQRENLRSGEPRFWLTTSVVPHGSKETNLTSNTATPANRSRCLKTVRTGESKRCGTCKVVSYSSNEEPKKRLNGTRVVLRGERAPRS